MSKKIKKESTARILYQETFKKNVFFNEQGKKDVIGWIKSKDAVVYAERRGKLTDGKEFIVVKIVL